jgi:ribosomal protein S18 acetylase RimI-like enzyme
MNKEVQYKFNQLINERFLSDNLNLSDIQAHFGSQYPDETLVLMKHLEHAYQPQQFYVQQITHLDSAFEQCYELMLHIFDPEVIDPKEILIETLTDEESHALLLGRFWETYGACRYNPDGQLVYFEYDPLTITRHIAGMISGNYISLPTRGESFGAIGQLATRPAHRNQKHGSQLVKAFEELAQQTAEEKQEVLVLNVLESEERARGFWTKMGYLYPQDSDYIQPPIDYDLETGEPLFEPVSEMLMVKLTQVSNTIQKGLLLQVLASLYESWYMPETTTSQAKQRVEELVLGKYYIHFEQSIAHHQVVPLVKPVV